MEDTLSVPSENELLSENFPLPEGIDSDRVDAADAILELGDVAVCKTTRSGFTTSAIIAAHRRGLKVLIVSPTRIIGSSTVKSTVNLIGGVHCNIPGNQSCKYVKEIIEKDEFLREMPIPKGKCSECDGYATCPVTEIERIGNFTVVTMTYAKLEAIAMSGKESKKFGKRLKNIDLVIFDEAHTISYPRLPQVDCDKHIVIPTSSWDSHAITGVYNKFRRLMDENEEHAEHIKFESESNPQHYTGFQIEISDPSSSQFIHFQFEQLLFVAETRKRWWSEDMANGEVLALKNIISIMGSTAATISYIKNNDIEKMIITSGQGDIEYGIRLFLLVIVPKAKVCFVSGTLIESRPGFFSELAVRELTNVIFPDLRKTNAKMHIHPSKWRFSALDSDNGIERAIKEIMEISRVVDHQPIYLIAMNKEIKNRLKGELIGFANIKMDYYRSEGTIGVNQPRRIAIAVGLAHVPRHTCDPLAQGADDHERYLDSQQLRLNEVHAATWQAWSRVKDPNGEAESHLYCVGVRAEEISDVVTWGTNRTIKVSFDAEGKSIWRVEVDEEFVRPIVHAEVRTSRGLNRHSIQEYIDRVQSIKSLIDLRMNSQKSTLFPYNNDDYTREIVDFFRNSNSLPLYLCNDPCDDDELDLTSFALTMLFTGRLDCHACQSKKQGRNGNYGFRKKETTSDITSLIMRHLNGSKTIGFYPFDTEDQCYYCAIGTRHDNAKKIVEFLLSNNLPVLVEKLVSSNSYYIWIPIIPAKTHTVYKFVRQLLHDAGVNGVDAYPKQKSIGACNKSCGDFLILPLGIDQEKNRISEFVDPMTFEPIEFVEVEKVIRLRDMPRIQDRDE